LPTPIKDVKLGWIGTGRWATRWPRAWRKALRHRAVERTRAKAEPLAKYGAKVVDRLAELASRDIVFCMVSTWEDVKEVMQKLLSGRRNRKWSSSAPPSRSRARPSCARCCRRKVSSISPHPSAATRRSSRPGSSRSSCRAAAGVRGGAAVSRHDGRGLGYVGEGELSRIVSLPQRDARRVTQSPSARSRSSPRRRACAAAFLVS